ncbi:MAG TPA: hypothetical protein VL527_19135, partial [Dongiaceae bacterium]|nr:hypothetical protein [Dongiaceae bacterium]
MTARTRKTGTSRRWLWLAVTAGAFLAAGILAWPHFWLNLPAGAGPAGLPVTPVAFAHPWTTQPVLLVGLGDSVTAG